MVDEDEVYFYTAKGFLDSEGIVYCPSGSPPHFVSRHEHLYGPWWWFYDDF